MKKWISMTLCVLLILGTVACGNGGKQGNSRGKVQLTFWAVINENNQSLMKQIVDEFNETNENYFVKLVPKTSGYSASLGGTLKGQNPPNIVQIDDRYFKGYVEEKYLTNLEQFFEDGKGQNGEVRKASTLDLDGVLDTAIERYRYDAETGYAGGDSPLYAMPAGLTPGVMYYNVTAMKDGGVNIISISEEEVASYNAENGTNYLAKAFEIYDTAPAKELTAKDGKYYVYNNQIPMSWEELVQAASLFTKSYNASSPTTYGFFNEWWFTFGWGVGGDCLEWDEEQGQYVMALGDEAKNYLVTGTDGVSVNGKSYKEGQILSYADKNYVNKVMNDSSHAEYAQISAYISNQNLYELPSMRDAFQLFLQLSQSKDKNVTDDAMGLAISPTPSVIGNKSKTNLLTSNEVLFVVDGYASCNGLGKAMDTLKKEWDVAPLYQYREYADNGELKKVNGTSVVGKLSTHSGSLGYAIPENSKSKDGSWEFIEYMSSPKVQETLMKANAYVPIWESLLNGETLAKCTSEYSPKNMNALAMLTKCSSIGDWSYLEDGEWVSVWSNTLNTDVRNGEMTLEEFFNDECISKTNELLGTSYFSKKYSD